MEALNVVDNVTFNGLNITPLKNWPTCRNPLFGAIFARNIRISESCEELTENNFIEAIKEKAGTVKFYPDLIVGGNDFIVLPVDKQTQEQKQNNMLNYSSPFFIPDCHTLYVKNSASSIGVGVVNLLNALNYIRLKPINYGELIKAALNTP